MIGMLRQGLRVMRPFAFFVLIAFEASPALATVVFYRDFATWDAARSAQSLTVATEVFSAAPSDLSTVNIGGASVNIGGAYDSTGQRIVQSGSVDLLFSIDSPPPSSLVYGYGFDWSGTSENVHIRVTEVGAASSSADTFGPGSCRPDCAGFFGVLSSLGLDLTQPGVFGSGYEAVIDVSPPSSLDNLSIAYAREATVPVPATIALVGLGLACIGHQRRKCLAA